MLSFFAAATQDPILWSDLGLVEGINLGFFTLRFYSLAYILGLLLAYWHLTKMIKVPGAPLANRHAEDLFFYCTLGVILGGRLGYAIFYTGGNTGKPSLFTNFTPTETISWDLLRLWDGGMSFHGGAVGVLAAIIWVCWRNKLSLIRVCDYIAVNTPFGMLLGRLANFNNGELWGRPSDVSWAMVFPGAGDAARHPSQLYQAGLEGFALMVIMLLLFWKTNARYRKGLMVGVFLLGMGAARFVVEYYREPDVQLRQFTAETGLSMGQWLSIPMALLGLGLLIWALTRPNDTQKSETQKDAAAA